MRLEPDATGRQKTVIARLCMGLKITEHLEERPMSQGDAGRLIRKLSKEIRCKRK